MAEPVAGVRPGRSWDRWPPDRCPAVEQGGPGPATYGTSRE
ncbi:hypothetical protein Ae263Ps1_3465 [Pseudonocardia sp. Ae263_Ps1]|nr:hypothetical protein Ae263Ps1_3465 [Pseudonocardia sp. Ae263_Ps1]